MKEYYIVSNKHARAQEYHWLFWSIDARGYTFDLNKAGLFKKDYGYSIIDKTNMTDRCKHENFMIHKDDLYLLGPIQKCVYR